MRNRLVRPCLLGPVLALLLGPCGVVMAQYGVVEETPVQPFKLMNWGGNLFLESHYQQDNETRSGSKVKTTDMYFREGMDLNLNGYLYHPNLIEWHSGFRLGFSQQDVTVGTLDRGTSGTVLGYDVSALFLKDKPVGGRVWATMSQDLLDRGFARALQYNRSTQGFEVSYRGDIPASLFYEHRLSTEESDSRLDDIDTHFFRLQAAYEPDQDFVTRGTYEYEDTTETSTFLGNTGGTIFSQDLPSRRHELSITNRYIFDTDDQPDQVNGQFRLLHREGFFPEDLLQISQQLDMAHTKTLSSFYRGTLNYDQLPDQTDMFVGAEAGVRKRFYDSLEASVRALGTGRQLSNGQETELGGFVDLNYVKKTPIGRFSSDLSIGRQYQTEQFDGDVRMVRDEAIFLSGISPVTLSQPNVVPGTVLVTDINNAVLYIEGFDYSLRTFGAFTEIVRIPTGGIVDGQTVLVDYSADSSRDAQYTTDTLVWRVRLALDVVPLGIYGEYRLRDEALISGIDPGSLERDQTMLGGLDYTIGPAILAAELESRELRLSPGYVAYRFRASASHRINDLTLFNASGSYEHRQYNDQQRFGFTSQESFLDTFELGAALNTKVRSDLLLRFDARYYQTQGRQEDSLARLRMGVDWSRGRIDVSLDTWLGYFTQANDEGVSAYIGVKVKRSF